MQVPQRPNAPPRVSEITAREAWARMGDPDHPAALLDVREPWEYVQGHAERAVSIPLGELQGRVSEVPRDRVVLLICHVGQRSLVAAKFLQRQGITQVANVLGGTDAWERAGLPMV